MLARKTIVVAVAFACATLTGACATSPARLAASASQPAPQHGVSEFALANGMKVFVNEDRRAPVVTVQVWYRVGASDEYDGITGISHALEHMMFKGTRRYPGDALSKTVKRAGGSNNAFTGHDYTAYFATLPANRLELGIELEADRMRGVIFRDEDFAKELEVVKEERRLRTDDKPMSRLYEQLAAAALNRSPYRRPVIGWMNDIENLTLDDIRRWHAQWYAPNNAMLIVSGDVEPREALRLAQKHFGPLPPAELPARKPQREPAQHDAREIELAAPAKRPHLALAWPAPAVGRAAEPWEPYALWLMSATLGGAETSRLQKHLVRERRIATSVSSHYSAYRRYDDVFVISATPLSNTSVEQLEAAIEEELAKFKNELVDEAELERARIQVRAGRVYAQDSVVGQAMRIGRLESLGIGWRAFYDVDAALAAVTPEQVRAVARKYLDSRRRTKATLLPQDKDANAGA